MALTKVTSALTDLDGGITIDNITIDGTEIDLSSGDLSIDVAGNIQLDADDNGEIRILDGGTQFATIKKDGNNALFQSIVADGDFIIQGIDGSSFVSAVTFDMSDAGKATFNAGINATTGSFTPSSGENFVITRDGAGPYIGNTSNHDLRIITNDAERMRIDSAGKVGIGGTPSVAHVDIKSTNSDKFLHLDDGTNVALTFSKNGTTSFVIQAQGTGFSSWKPLDLRANYFEFKPNNTLALTLTTTSADFTHTASAHTNGIKIINSQAGGYGSALTFQSERSDNNVIDTAGRIRSEGAEAWNADDAVSSAFPIFESATNGSLTEKARFNSSGHLLIGVTSFGNSGGGSEIRGGLMKSSADTTSTHTHNFFTNANGAVGSIQTNGSATQFNTSSDGRLKDVTGKARGLEVINQLNPVAYNWKADGKSDEGLIPQEVMNIVPNAVNQNEDNKYYQMDYSKLVTPLIKAIQEQQKEIEELKQNSHAPKTIEEMEGYEDLINRIKELENK